MRPPHPHDPQNVGRSPLAGLPSPPSGQGKKQFESTALPHRVLRLHDMPDVEPFHHDAWRLAPRVGVFQFRTERLPLAGHQGNVVVAIDRRQDSVSRLFPHGFQSDHQRRLGRGVVQLSR